MTARKCFKAHYTQEICSYGYENRIFGWMCHEFDCPKGRQSDTRQRGNAADKKGGPER